MSIEYINVLTRTNTVGRPKSEHPRTIKKKQLEMPPEIFAALEKDAERCRRPLNKHMEAIFVAYLDLDSVELQDINRARHRLTAANERHFAQDVDLENDKEKDLQRKVK